ncbi:MAG: MurR/RpiR family transcriptional regulator [Bacillota bacterium]|nr:MurR/RpiR family transcriptional regulator [Bacillota bacterium]
MNSAKQHIRDVYEQLTTVERSIATYFLGNEEQRDFCQRSVANRLYVSEASLSRFAQKCQYKGYREFVWHYEHDLARRAALAGDPAAPLLSLRDDCQYQLDLVLARADTEQMRRISLRLEQSPRIYVLGACYAGLAAREFELRFLHLGLAVQAVTTVEDMPLRAGLVTEDDVVIGMTAEAACLELEEALLLARERGAFTVLVTTEPDFAKGVTVDECILVGNGRKTGHGIERSPQLPLLLVTDALYAMLHHNG